MKEQEIKEVLEKHGYTLDRIVRFKTCDRIRWKSKTLDVSLNLAKKIEDISLEQFLLFVV